MNYRSKPKEWVITVENNLSVMRLKEGCGIFAEVEEEDQLGNAVSTSYQPISQEIYTDYETARKAIDDNTYKISKDLLSFYIASEQENQNYSISIKVVPTNTTSVAENRKYMIVEMAEEYNDDGPNIEWIENIISVETWDTELEAIRALKVGNWTRLKTIQLKTIDFSREPIQALTNLKGTYDVARPWLMLMGNGKLGHSAELNYWEVVARDIQTKEEAELVLSNYWETFMSASSQAIN